MQPQNMANDHDLVREQIQALMAQAKALNIDVLSSPKVDRSKAPDGGPRSEAHKFLPAKLVPTKKVLRVMEGFEPHICIINADEYDPDIHKPLDWKPETDEFEEDELDPQPRAKKRTRTTQLLTKKQLEAMALSDILLLPEASNIEHLPDSKEETIAAMLEARN